MKAFLKFRILTLLTIVIVSIASCKKGDDSNIFPLEVYGTKLEVSSATRLYTKDGEIKDAKKIAKFVEKLNYFHAENDKSGLGTLEMTFLSKDSVFFGSDKTRFSVSKNDSQFIFTSALAFLQPVNHSLTEHIVTHLFKHRNVAGSVTIPIFNGNNGSETVSGVKEVRVAYGNYVELKFPMLAYSVTSKVGSADAYWVANNSGVVNNEFDKTALSSLMGNDTLAVKLYMVTCRKK